MDGYGMDISMLRGLVVKVVLVSSPIGGRRPRLYGVETEQRLSLSEKGGASLTRYYEMEEDEELAYPDNKGETSCQPEDGAGCDGGDIGISAASPVRPG